MTQLAEIVISALIVAGGLFALVGSLGLLKLPTLMMRLHGPTKATTLGVGGCLLASMLYFPVFTESSSAHELLITFFLFLTAPITANMIAKAHLLRLAREERSEDKDAPPPRPGPSGVWSTLRPAVGTPAVVSRSEPPLRRPPAGSPRK
jgi:multicomponent K+:H+ antiporter subunit G